MASFNPKNTDVVGDGPTATASPSEIAKVTNEAKSIMSIATAFLTQPFTVGKILMQVGYEPFPPTQGVSLIRRRPGLYYPNTYSYLWKLRGTEGLATLFTGFTAKAFNVFIGRATELTVDDTLRKVLPYTGEDAKEPDQKKGFVATLYNVAVECVSKSVVIVVTQPLHVVMVRMICSIINKDEVYRGFFSSVKEIYNTEGLAGFFTGLVPRWISEIATVSMTGVIMYGVYRVLENTIEDENLSTSPNYHALVQFFVYGQWYKYQLTSTVVAASCNGLNIGLSPYDSWLTCYADLQFKNQLKRGEGQFYRLALAPR